MVDAHYLTMLLSLKKDFAMYLNLVRGIRTLDAIAGCNAEKSAGTDGYAEDHHAKPYS